MIITSRYTGLVSLAGELCVNLYKGGERGITFNDWNFGIGGYFRSK